MQFAPNQIVKRLRLSGWKAEDTSTIYRSIAVDAGGLIAPSKATSLYFRATSFAGSM
jgi:hypothetical protein